MNAAVVDSFDAPPRFATFADPVPADGERLVTVTAAGLHPIVKALAKGIHYASTGQLPFVPGVDGVGNLEDGTRVYFGAARAPYGSFAERGLASFMCIPVPYGIDDVTAAAIANPAMSSWVALTARAKFTPGESVLILGAAGVAGQLAIQIARRLGARRVIAAGRGSLDKLKALGADAIVQTDEDPVAVVSALRTELADSGIDVVLDYLWGHPAERFFEAILQKGFNKKAPRVRYIQIGESAGKTIPLSASMLRSSGVELLGSGFGSASFDQIRQSIVDFFATAAKDSFQFRTKAVPLRDVEALWSTENEGLRIVFQP
jgi:NADPH:quinone reductase-like Zn-dependent oxidoreductase